MFIFQEFFKKHKSLTYLVYMLYKYNIALNEQILCTDFLYVYNIGLLFSRAHCWRVVMVLKNPNVVIHYFFVNILMVLSANLFNIPDNVTSSSMRNGPRLKHCCNGAEPIN